MIRFMFVFLCCCNLAIAENSVEDQVAVCAIVQNIASKIMGFRQTDGSTITDAMKLPAQSGELETVVRELTIKAWQQPFYSNAEIKNDVIKSFADSALSHCLAGIK